MVTVQYVNTSVFAYHDPLQSSPYYFCPDEHSLCIRPHVLLVLLLKPSICYDLYQTNKTLDVQRRS